MLNGLKKKLHQWFHTEILGSGNHIHLRQVSTAHILWNYIESTFLLFRLKTESEWNSSEAKKRCVGSINFYSVLK